MAKINFKKYWECILLVCFTIILTMWLIFGKHGFLYLKNRRIELQEYSKKVDKLEQEKLKLEKEISLLHTDKKYLEHVVKEETDMIKKNEVKYIFKRNDDVTKQEKKDSNQERGYSSIE